MCPLCLVKHEFNKLIETTILLIEIEKYCRVKGIYCIIISIVFSTVLNLSGKWNAVSSLHGQFRYSVAMMNFRHEVDGVKVEK